MPGAWRAGATAGACRVAATVQGWDALRIFWSVSLSEGLRAVSISSWHRSGLMMRARETHSGREEATMRRTGSTVTWDTSDRPVGSPCYKPRDVCSLRSRLQVPAAAVTVFGG